LFDLPLCGWFAFRTMDDASPQTPQGTPKLDARVGLRRGHRVAITLMGHPAKDTVVIEVVRQGPTISLHGLAYHLQVGPTGLAGDQQRSDHPPGVIVLGEQQVLIAPECGQPTMAGRIVLKEDARLWHLEAHIDFALFLWPLVIITMAQREPADTVRLKWATKLLVRFLREQGKVELAAIELGLIPNIASLLMEELLHLRWKLMPRLGGGGV